MAIDAVIERLRPDPEGLRLQLAPRYMPDVGYDSCPGQPALIIVGTRSFEPEVGMFIWGGADQCEIIDAQSRQSQWYRRFGIVRLEEKRDR